MLKFYSDGHEQWSAITTNVVAVEGLPDHFVATVDFEAGWWGTWCSFRTLEGRIVDLLWDDDNIQNEQCMHKIRGFCHPAWQGVIVEAYGMTHMGNGHYYLMHVHDGRIELLVETRAVDVNNCDCILLEGTLLPARYYDFDKDGYTDVVLTGSKVLLEDEKDGWTVLYLGWDGLETKVRKVFLWNPARARFEREALLDLGFFD